MTDKLTVTWLKEYEGEIRTLEFASPEGRTNNPLRRGVGIYVDTDGALWEVKGMFLAQEAYILARFMGGDDKASKKWLPYKLDLVRGTPTAGRTDEGTNEADTDRRLAPAGDDTSEA